MPLKGSYDRQEGAGPAYKMSRSGSRSSSHSRLDLLADVAIGEASSQASLTGRQQASLISQGSVEDVASSLRYRPRKRVCTSEISSRGFIPDHGQAQLALHGDKVNGSQFVGGRADSRSNSQSHMDTFQAQGGSSAAGLGDKRKSIERLSWTGELQARFVRAVSHLGLENAVPKEILRLMQVEDLTREQVASHLQKYRLAVKNATSSTTAGVAIDEASHLSSRAMGTGPDLPGRTAWGLPVDLFASRHQLGAPNSTCQGTRDHPAKRVCLQGKLQHKSADPDSPEEAAFSRIHKYVVETEAAMTAEFKYPPMPPAYVPTKTSLDETPLVITPLKRVASETVTRPLATHYLKSVGNSCPKAHGEISVRQEAEHAAEDEAKQI